jgi:hypothetical protein
MADLKIKIIVLPTYDVTTMYVADASTYPDDPPVDSPILLVTPPGFPAVSLEFVPGTYAILTSDLLNIGTIDMPLPDGVYILNYSVTPAYQNFNEVSLMRVDQLQEKFDIVFMNLDMMECESAVKTQAKVTLNTIYLLIQGSIAAANNCAVIEATKLYNQADTMLNNMIKKNCGCTGTNYLNNF